MNEDEDKRFAAEAFLKAVRSGDGDSVRAAAEWLSETVDGWSLAFRGAARIRHVNPDVQAAFASIWVESKSLSRQVDDRSLLTPALRLLLPGSQVDGSISIYRGTNWREHHHHAYGFSWTTNPETAECFARRRERDAFVMKWPEEMRGVVLTATVPPSGVLLKREAGEHYDEEEVVVDPTCLANVAPHKFPVTAASN